MSGLKLALDRSGLLDGFVIEARLREGTEKEKDTPRYHWHWYGGLTIHPDTGKWVKGRWVDPVLGAFWSPHFSDCAVFATAEIAQTEIEKVIGPQLGAVVVPINKSHFAESWS